MAIEAIASPKTAHQGRVPKVDSQVSAESSKAMPDPPVAEVKAPEEPARKKANEYTADAKQKPKEENEAADSAKAAERPAGNEAMRKAVDEINRHITNSEVVFGIHDKTNRVTIKIVDKDSRKVLKEYPPEQTLDMIAKVWEIAGIMVDEKR